MAITVEQRTSIIELVVGMFGAAPGASVLSDLVAAYEKGQTLKQIAANLANTNEFKGIFPTFLTNSEFATKVVDQLVGSEVVAAEKAAAVTTLTGMLNAGASRSSVFVDAIAAVNAITSTNAAWANAGAAFDNKVAVAVYYSVDKQLSGSTLQQLQNVIGTVTSSATTVNTAKGSIDNVGNPGTSFAFTVGVDALTGGSGDDTFNAVVTGTSAVLGALDVADGGTGKDTINIVDTSVAATADYNLPTGLTIKNIEIMNVTTNGALGTEGGTAFDVSGVSGLTSFIGTAAGAGSVSGSNVKVANTTDVNLTVAGANSADLAGGKEVTINANTGAVGVTGSALTTVTVTKGGAATIDNTSSAGTTSVGTTLKTVVLNNDADSAVKGAALATIDLKGQGDGGTARTVTLTNGTANLALTVNANGTGYQSTGTEKQTVVTQAAATATSATINTSAKSSLDLSGITTVKSLTLTGAGALKLAAMGATTTSIDGSAATGALTLGTLNAATVTVKTGAGADTFTVSATAKTTVETGAGNDKVTLGSAVAATSTINLGAGDDTLLAGGGSVATSTSTVIDGGDGNDSVAANLINAGNAAQFKNFEKVNLDSTTGLDLALLTGNTISSLTMSSATTTATYQNVKVANGLTVDFVGNNSGFTNTLTFADATGTADTYTITFAGVTTGTPGSANVRAGTLSAQGIENYSIVSGGTSAWNEITLGNNTAAKTVAITGAAKLDLAFAATFGTAGATTGVSLIDGSAATGALVINTTNVTVTTASSGLTVKGGSAADTITLAQKATVDAGAGNDTVTVSANGGSIATGAGADTVNVSAAVVGTATPAGAVITALTDLASGDKIIFANLGTEVFTTTKINVNTATALIGGTVNALDLAAAAADSTTNGQITWFQYAGDTYIVQELGANSTTIGTDDIVVKLTGLVDLSGATYDAAANSLTLA